MLFESSAAKKSKEVQKLLKSMVEEKGIMVKHISPIGFKYDSAFWIAVNTDAEREIFYNDQEFRDQLYAVFEKTGYLKIIEDVWNKKIKNPDLNYLKKPSIAFESQETVDRDYGGNWYYAMK